MGQEFRGSEEGAWPGSFWPGEIGCRTTDAGLAAQGSIWIDGPVLPIAFRIYWRFGGEDHLVGSFAAYEGDVRGFEYSALLDASVPEIVDVVLKPDRRLAFEELNVWKIWGEDVLLQDFPVTHEE